MGIRIEPLIAGYAIAAVPENLVDTFASMPEIEYVEKPKRLFFSAEQGKRASCIIPVTTREPFLSGSGTFLAVIDSGIAYDHPVFRNADGTTKIRALWDQTLRPDDERGFLPPEGFSEGVLFTKDQIDDALQQSTREGQLQIVPSIDQSGHGTAVAGIASEVAPGSELLIVKLGKPQENSFPQTTELMRALTFVTRESTRGNMPVSINLSFGNTYGSHDGTSLLERFMDNVSEIGRTTICVGSGNEASQAGHLTGIVNAGEDEVIELVVGDYESAFSVQLWKNYVDEFTITIQSPDGQEQMLQSNPGSQTLSYPGTQILAFIGEPTPYSVNQEIYLDFVPQNQNVTSGIWEIRLIPQRIVTGEYSLYLPSAGALSGSTGFYRSSPERTLTIPSTARKVITVGAYNVRTDAYADFSGRGYLTEQAYTGGYGILSVKPDLVAPGVNIRSAAPGGSYGSFTGTSFAAPFVAGSAALMMEWGIIQGNDAYLYGEKVKAYLIRGARQLPGMVSPNPMTGDCVKLVLG